MASGWARNYALAFRVETADFGIVSRCGWRFGAVERWFASMKPASPRGVDGVSANAAGFAVFVGSGFAVLLVAAHRFRKV